MLATLDKQLFKLNFYLKCINPKQNTFKKNNTSEEISIRKSIHIFNQTNEYIKKQKGTEINLLHALVEHAESRETFQIESNLCNDPQTGIRITCYDVGDRKSSTELHEVGTVCSIGDLDATYFEG